MDVDRMKETLEQKALDSLFQAIIEFQNKLPPNDEKSSCFIKQLNSLQSFLKRNIESCREIERSIEEEESGIYFIREQAAAAKANYDQLKSTKLQLQEDISKYKEDAQNFKVSETTKKEQVKDKIKQNEEMSERMKFGSDWTDEQISEREELIASIDEMKSALEKSKLSLESVRSDVWNKNVLIQAEQEKESGILSEVDSIEQMIRTISDQSNMQARSKESLEEEIKRVLQDIQHKITLLDKKESMFLEECKNAEDEEAKMEEMKATVEGCLKVQNDLICSAQTLKKNIEKQMDKNKKLSKENVKTRELLSEKKLAAKIEKKNLAKLKKMQEIMHVRNNEAEKERASTEKYRDEIKLTVKNIEGAEISQVRKSLETKRRQADDLKRELDVLARKVNLSQNGTSQISELTNLNNNNLKNLENEVAGLRKTVMDQQAIVDNFSRDQQKLNKDLAARRVKQTEMVDELNVHGQKLGELEKELFQTESKLKQQQNMYECAQYERNIQSKSLSDIHGEILDMKKRSQIIERQSNQLKQDISKAETNLVKEHYHHYYSDKDKQRFQDEIKKTKIRIASLERTSASHDLEKQRLLKVAEETDLEYQTKQKERSNILNERDTLGVQLVAENDLIKNLDTQIKLKLSIIYREGLYYQAKLSEIDSLSTDCEIIMDERKEIGKKIKSIDSLNRRCIALSNELLAERSKNKALSEEIGRPINVHRWRHLEHSDPKRFEMVCKIQNLQTRIISTSDELMKIDKLIQEKENIYLDLKCSLGRLAPYEGAESEIKQYRIRACEQKRQMISLSSELELYKLKVDKLRDEISEVDKKNQELKDAWIKKKTDELYSSDTSNSSIK